MTCPGIQNSKKRIWQGQVLKRKRKRCGGISADPEEQRSHLDEADSEGATCIDDAETKATETNIEEPEAEGPKKAEELATKKCLLMLEPPGETKTTETKIEEAEAEMKEHIEETEAGASGYPAAPRPGGLAQACADVEEPKDHRPASVALETQTSSVPEWEASQQCWRRCSDPKATTIQPSCSKKKGLRAETEGIEGLRPSEETLMI